MSEWRNIKNESIPKNNRRYLISDGKEVDFARVSPDGSIYTYTYSVKPTHWMPLPEAPKEVNDE